MSNGNMTPQEPKKSDEGDDFRGRPPRPRNFAGVALIILVLVIVWLVIQNQVSEPDKIKLPQLVEHLAKGNVAKITVEKNVIEAELEKKDPKVKSKKVRVVMPEDTIIGMAAEFEYLNELGQKAAAKNDKETEAFCTMLSCAIVGFLATGTFTSQFLSQYLWSIFALTGAFLATPDDNPLQTVLPWEKEAPVMDFRAAVKEPDLGVG